MICETTHLFKPSILGWTCKFSLVSRGGNEGPNPGTIGSPGGIPEAFAVGATDKDDKVTDFSSRGPVTVIDMDGNQKTYRSPKSRLRAETFCHRFLVVVMPLSVALRWPLLT
jgi:hypothetical protein